MPSSWLSAGCFDDQVGGDPDQEPGGKAPQGDLSVRPLRQHYRRLAADRWEYADDEYGAFEFTVDADRIAVDYERLATRLD